MTQIKPENIIPPQAMHDALVALCPDKIEFLVGSAMDMSWDPRFTDEEKESIQYDLYTMELFDRIVLATRMSSEDMYMHIKQLRGESV